MKIQSSASKERLRQIRCIVMDVDGVLSDGKITYSSTGEELKSFNVKDGLGISLALKAGMQLAIITARTSAMVEQRAVDLKIQHVFQGIKNKLPTLTQLASSTEIPLTEMLYIGDDLPDLPCMRAVALSACPADSDREVLAQCDLISAFNGGDGAVREIITFVLDAQSVDLIGITTPVY
ncbi:MAG: HAD-IIIA family hydrolase [Cyanobacteria bacterium P01_H01_bin.74]